MKKRDSETTRARITDCAQQLFTQKGYDGAGVREIAACAEVDAALIARYFGSKRQLFEEAVVTHFNLDPLMDIDPDAFAEVVSRDFAFKPKDAHKAFDPMIALLKSISSAEVADLICEALDRQIVGPLAEKIGGSDAKARAAMIVAFLGGFDLMRRIVGVPSMGNETQDRLAAELQQAIASVISRG